MFNILKKKSICRLLLISICLYPSMTTCFNVLSILIVTIIKGDIILISYTISYLASMLVYIWFFIDTVTLYKQGK